VSNRLISRNDGSLNSARAMRRWTVSFLVLWIITMQTDLGEALLAWGFTPFFHQQFLVWADEHPDLAAEIGRVASVRRGDCLIVNSDISSRRAVLAGRLLRDAEAIRPCVGDFVAVDWNGSAEPGRIEHVFERTSLFQRKRPALSSRPQPIAANIDLAIIVCSLSAGDMDTRAASRGVNVHRIERYLCASAEAGVPALVIVNKADLWRDSNRLMDLVGDIRANVGAVDVLAVSARLGTGLELLAERMPPRTTSVLVGSSGVGKSSLVNGLLGRATQRAATIREADGRGRHTTTARELFALPWGALLIDTPGMRELGLVARRVEIESGAHGDPVGRVVGLFAKDCRFRDCRHELEPGCAVRAAVERGDLAEARLDHARKLERELAWQRVRQDAALQSQEKRSLRAFARDLRARQREKGRT
jgi:ribosome biogenesis GTPase